MTELLEQAFALAAKLTPKQQDEFADWLLKELDSENRWNGAFGRTKDALSNLAAEALAELHAEETQELDPDSL